MMMEAREASSLLSVDIYTSLVWHLLLQLSCPCRQEHAVQAQTTLQVRPTQCQRKGFQEIDSGHSGQKSHKYCMYHFVCSGYSPVLQGNTRQAIQMRSFIHRSKQS
eukprot:1160966-Pelagomonas_calceolata.AAC.2